MWGWGPLALISCCDNSVSACGKRHCGYGLLVFGQFLFNAQHVDIVRGAALFPWLLQGVDGLLHHVTSLRFALCVPLTWQLLVGS